MPLCAIICDIDGCLTPETSAPMDAHALARIADHNHRAITARASARAGAGANVRCGQVPPILTLCSGRPQPFVEAMCRLLGNSTLPAIAENGVWLYFPESNRYERDPRILPEHVRAVHDLERWVETTLGPRGVTIQPGKSASVSLYHQDTAYLRALVPMLEAACAAVGWPFRVSMTWYYINCDLSFVSKGSAIRRWIEHTGLPREALLGIGDTDSDLPVLEEVGTFACPANAQERIRARSTYVAATPEIDGVLEILEWACAHAAPS